MRGRVLLLPTMLVLGVPLFSCSAAADFMEAATKEIRRQSETADGKKDDCYKACQNSKCYHKRVLGAGSTGKCRKVCRTKLPDTTQRCLARASTRGAFSHCLSKAEEKSAGPDYPVVASGGTTRTKSGKAVVFEALSDTILLPAPDGTLKENLGQALSLELRNATAETGGLGRAYPLDVRTSHNVNKCEFTLEEISDQFSLNANADYLFVKGTAGVDSSSRYLVYRAYCIDSIDVLQTNRAGLKPVGEGYLTPTKIYYGWALHAVVSGNKQKLTLGMKADLKKWGASLASKLESQGLNLKYESRGLVPKGNSVPIITSLGDIQSQMERASDSPSPILVEYTATRDFEAERIFWKRGSSTVKGRLQVSITSLELNDRKSRNGRLKSWDGVGAGGPDPAVRVSFRTQRNWKEVANCLQEDTLSVNSSRLEDILVPLEEHTTLRIEVVDQDVQYDDFVASVTVRNLLEYADGTKHALDTSGTGLNKLEIRVEPVFE